MRATQRFDPELVAELRSAPIPIGEGAVGRVALTRQPVEIPDIQDPGAYESRLRDAMARSGLRAVLAVPLVREGRVLGGLVVARKNPGRFAPEVVDLLKTLAAQSAIAIQNARLFSELEDKSRELEAASRHKSEFLANMSPRAPHAAQRDHRLLRGPRGAHVRRAQRQAGRVHPGHPRPRAGTSSPSSTTSSISRRSRRAGWSSTSRASTSRRRSAARSSSSASGRPATGSRSTCRSTTGSDRSWATSVRSGRCS